MCSVFNTTLTLSHLTSDGVLDSGYIEAVDPHSGTAARGLAPAKFLDGLAVDRRLTFYANAVDVDGTGFFASNVAPLITIEYGAVGSGLGGTLVYGTTNLPDEIGTWKFYDVTISADDAGWRYFDNLLDPDALALSERDATPNDFTTFLGTATEPALAERLTFIMEWLQDDDDLDTGGLDSVHLVPVPAALPLLLSALFGLGFTTRRRR